MPSVNNVTHFAPPRRSSARIDRDPGLARPLHLWMRGPGGPDL